MVRVFQPAQGGREGAGEGVITQVQPREIVQLNLAVFLFHGGVDAGEVDCATELAREGAAEAVVAEVQVGQVCQAAQGSRDGGPVSWLWLRSK